MRIVWIIKNLDVLKKGMELVAEVYTWTKLFPREEKYGLISQMRRAAVSIPTNITEVSARKGDKELLYFVNIAIGSISELKKQFILVIRLEMAEENEQLHALLIDEKKLLLGYRNYINKKND